MSKQPSEDTNFLGDGELPPPYTADQPTFVNSSGGSGLAPAYSAATPLSPSSTIHPDSLFAAQLASMRCQIRDQQATRASLQDQSDTRLLSLLIPHVEDMLASVAAMDPPPRLVQMTLVPDPAVARDWMPSETHRGRSGETHELLRVQTTLPAKMTGDRKQAPPPTTTTTAAAAASSGSEFDGWGRWGDDARHGGSQGDLSSSRSDKELWWSDEDMARRLARYLQPARKVVAVDRQTVAAKVAEAKKAKSRWSILGSSKNKSGSGSEVSTPTTPTPRLTSVRVEEDVSMAVTAEEVTFRRENEMGIWESNTGWGVVVRVKIRS